MNLRYSISCAVLKLRNERGFSQKELASKIGISRTYLSRIECCRVDMRISILEKLAKAFDMSATDFLNVGKDYDSRIENIKYNDSFDNFAHTGDEFGIKLDKEIINTFNPSTIQIGNKLWMTENLKYDDGEGGIIYNPNNGEYCYTWDAAMRVAKKLGWKLPSAEDWNKAAEECDAKCVNPEEKNTGYRNYEVGNLKTELKIKLAGAYDGSFYGIGYYAFFWTSSEWSKARAYCRLFSNSSYETSDYYNKYRQFSVRLVKDI